MTEPRPTEPLQRAPFRPIGLSPRALAILFTVVVFLACSIPGDALADSILLSYDKLWHLGAFAWFTLLWRRAGWGPWRTLAAGVGFGFLIEVWQHVAPINRTFDLYDLLADTVGVLLGLAVVAAFRRWQR